MHTYDYEDLFLKLYDERNWFSKEQLKILINQAISWEDSYCDYTCARTYTIKIKNRFFNIYKIDYLDIGSLEIHSEIRQPIEIRRPLYV